MFFSEARLLPGVIDQRPAVHQGCHRGSQIFIVLDPRLWKMLPDFALAVHGFSIREAEGLLKSAGNFRHNLIRPSRQKETWASSQPKECVSQGHWNEDAGIEDYGTSTLHSSVPPSGNTFRSYKPALNASRARRSSAARRSLSRFLANSKTSRR